MHRKHLCTAVVAAAVFFGPARTFAQYPEDALRLAQPGIGIGPRATGMGGAFLPIADDYSATFWNPAGLGQLQYKELAAGFSGVFFSNDAVLHNATSSASLTDQFLDDIGLVYPVTRAPLKGLALSFGYNLVSDFSATTAFSGFEPSSSIIQSSMRDTTNFRTSIPYLLGLAGYARGVPTSPVQGRLQQAGRYEEGGGVHAVSIGGGVQLVEGLNLGVALHLYTGSYTYARHYTETDVTGAYVASDTTNWTTVNLYQYAQNDNVNSTITGVGATFGLLYTIHEAASLGVTVSLPSSFHVDETWSVGAQASDHQGNVTPASPLVQQGTDSYDATTPLTFGGGVAVHPIHPLTLAASGEFVDYTRLRFANTDPSVLDYNLQMGDIFRPAFDYRLGAEYKIVPIGLGLRAGYAFLQSAYREDPSSSGTHLVTAGASLVLARRGVLDLAYVHSSAAAVHQLYSGSAQTSETVRAGRIMLGFSYRFP